MNTIEKLIQQKSFKDKKHRAVVSLLYAAYLTRDHHEKLFNEYGITAQQFNVLRILRGQHPKPSTIGLIKERMLDRNSDVSRIVDRLVKAGHVQRLECASDRRAVDVIISSSGLEILAHLDEKSKELDIVFEGFSDEEIIEFNQFLDKVISNISPLRD